jgi:hypothetical protein
VLCAGARAVAAEPSIRLNGIPDRLVMPVPAGRNLVLTATVKGAPVRAVWLGPDRESKLRVLLTRVDDTTYQVNLADADVAAVARAAAGRRQFRVFAETADGKVVASIPVRYAAATVPRRPFRCIVRLGTKGQRTRTVSTWHTAWFAPDEVQSLEAHVSAAADTVVQARIHTTTWAFTPAGDPPVHTLTLGKELREAWKARGTLTVQYGGEPRWRTLCTLRVRPAALAFPGNVASVIVRQRRTQPVPGSCEFLSLGLGDITGMQVLTTLRDAEGKTLVATRAMGQGDRASFTYGGVEYVMTLRRLVNVLIGDDWATFEFSTVAADEQVKIDALLARVAAAEVTFLRNGREYTAAQAAEHLRRKYNARGPKVTTVRGFIEQIGSRSSTTGKPYRVKMPEGMTMTAGDWLRGLNAAPPPEKVPPPSEPPTRKE